MWNWQLVQGVTLSKGGSGCERWKDDVSRFFTQHGLCYPGFHQGGFNCNTMGDIVLRVSTRRKRIQEAKTGSEKNLIVS